MIKEIECYAKENNIPIMLSDGIDYLCEYIRKHSVKRILEIGTAIGYSAIRMALVDDSISIVSIERDKARYDIAVSNVHKFGLENRIQLLFGDALEVEVNSSFDLIFIDASKGHSIDFFEKYEKKLQESGVIITDNLSFHGLVEDENLILTKNQRGLVRKIKNFIMFLDSHPNYETEYVLVGDKISISRRKN